MDDTITASMKDGETMMKKIAEQEVYLVRKGGLILHNYSLFDMRDSLRNQKNALDRGVLEFIGDKHMHYIFRKTDQAIGTKGGIDLTAGKTPLEIQNSGSGIKFHMDPAMLQRLKDVPGFVPVIISVKPLVDLPGFLGLQNNNVLHASPPL